MCLATPTPNAPGIAAPITATRSTRRPWPGTKVARSVSIGLLLLCLGFEPALGRLAPLDGPLGETDPQLQGQVGTLWSLARVRLDRAQVGERTLLPGAHRPNDLYALLGQTVREEQLEHPFVAQL